MALEYALLKWSYRCNSMEWLFCLKITLSLNVTIISFIFSLMQRKVLELTSFFTVEVRNLQNEAVTKLYEFL